MKQRTSMKTLLIVAVTGPMLGSGARACNHVALFVPGSYIKYYQYIGSGHTSRCVQLSTSQD